MKIAITTPTGQVGSQVVDFLLEDGDHDLVLLARHASKVHDAVLRGAEVVEGDQHDREYVTKATRGADVLFWVVPPDRTTNDAKKYYREMAETAVASARANNIRRVVFLSSVGGHLGEGVGIVNVYRDAEQIFRGHFDNLRILRPAYFMENLLRSRNSIVRSKSIALPVKADTTVPMIATRDIASAAAALLKKPFSGTRVIELLGPRDYGFAEATRIIGDAIGEKLSFVTISPEQAVKAISEQGSSEHMARQVVGLLQGMDSGCFRSEFPRSADSTTPTTLEEFARTVLAPSLARKT